MILSHIDFTHITGSNFKHSNWWRHRL